MAHIRLRGILAWFHAKQCKTASIFLGNNCKPPGTGRGCGQNPPPTESQKTAEMPFVPLGIPPGEPPIFIPCGRRRRFLGMPATHATRIEDSPYDKGDARGDRQSGAPRIRRPIPYHQRRETQNDERHGECPGYSGSGDLLAARPLERDSGEGQKTLPLAPCARTNGAPVASPRRRAAAVASDARWDPLWGSRSTMDWASCLAPDANIGTDKIGVWGRHAQHAKA